eukprot:1518677-Pyramimonas_sp.AAC.2
MELTAHRAFVTYTAHNTIRAHRLHKAAEHPPIKLLEKLMGLMGRLGSQGLRSSRGLGLMQLLGIINHI